MIKPLVKICSLIAACCASFSALAYTDPTRPPGFMADPKISTSMPLVSIQLTAIFTFPTYKVAIINGNAFKLGERLNEYTITRIGTNTVELEGPQNSREQLNMITVIKK